MNMPEDELVKFAKVNFFQLAKRDSNPRIRIRLLALGHLQIGKKKKEIIEMFQITLITLRRWVLRFTTQGINGLNERSGKGSQDKAAYRTRRGISRTSREATNTA